MIDPSAPHIQDLIADRLSRRGVLVGLAGLSALAVPAAAAEASAAPALSFTPVAATTADRVTAPAGYVVEPLIGWGDPLFEGAGPLDLDGLTRAEQERRFGANNDMLALFPARWSFPKDAAQRRYLLCANHEYFDPGLMYPGATSWADYTPARIEAMYAAMGVSVVQLAADARGRLRVVRDSASGQGLNRRITPFTPVMFAGPARGHRWIEAAAAMVATATGGPRTDGLVACGTHSNCAGGETPWGTYLSAEENFNGFFGNYDPARTAPLAAADPALARDAASFGWPLSRAPQRFLPGAPAQFDVAQNPTGPALYGWTVEIDPYDPTWAPRKRTALGRRKGECATTALTRDGRVAVYAGDDQVDEFVYKFVTAGRFDPRDRLANRDLLDEGQLYAARFEPNGAGRWLALTLEAANAAAAAAGYAPAFADAGDLAVRAREAARLLGATPMDRPEDVEALCGPDWVGQGPVYIACTKNPRPRPEGPARPARPDPGAPGAPQPNLAGHVLRLDEAGGDCAAETFRWDVHVMGGDAYAAAPIVTARNGGPLHAGTEAFGAQTAIGDRFACPDNIFIDQRRTLWITTDGSEEVFGDCNDSVLALPAQAPAPRAMRRFLVGPVGSEICGPVMTPDERTFLCAIQHPGESSRTGEAFSEARFKGAQPFSRFPDGGWPRSAVVVVRRRDGGLIGG